MKSLFAAATLVALAAVAAPASAQTSGYGAAGYTFVDGAGVDLGALTGRLGARFGQYVGVEGEASFGVNDETVRVGAVPVKIELEHAVSLNLVGFLPLSDKADLFARVGYGTAEIKGSALGVNVSVDGDYWGYGLGAQYFFDGANGVRGEYTRADFQNGGGEMDNWTISYVRKF